ncbi:uncharacterized protein LOC119473942 [Cebus imitator]|uniref:uncharacterized protein LOC119473942 n=1 Tax=Cebus imitator TaxID=2715852 RepID=UPI001897C7DE|nr:uncharacterized protein LOC119473942 [Cebus imitator]
MRRFRQKRPRSGVRAEPGTRARTEWERECSRGGPAAESPPESARSPAGRQRCFWRARFHFAKSVSRAAGLSSPHLGLPLQGHPPSPGRPRLASEEGRGALAQREGWRNSGSEEKAFRPGPSTKGFYRDDQHPDAVGRGGMLSAPPPWGPRGTSRCKAEPSGCERAPPASCAARKRRVRAFVRERVPAATAGRGNGPLYIALPVDRHINRKQCFNTCVLEHNKIHHNLKKLQNYENESEENSHGLQYLLP